VKVWALFEPFIDTVVVCTMTTLVLIVTRQIMVGAEIDMPVLPGVLML
jgi:Na+/alanine symporter